MGENRFASLQEQLPDKADALYAKEVEDVKARYERYKKPRRSNLLQKSPQAVKCSLSETLYPLFMSRAVRSCRFCAARDGTSMYIPIHSLIQ